MNINEKQNLITTTISALDDWDRYEFLITKGKTHNNLKENFQSEDNLISDCQSQVWISAQIIDGKIFYLVDSDSLIIKGILHLFTEILNNQPAEDVANAELFFLEKSGLHSKLSPSRANGVNGIMSRIKEIAKNFC
ncbi:SufE family protein [Chitinispirillales bacterium ANBcel5]|uniref:SufE family protein n=1 Tax=Cellulosispirillum alkaliphilum TaxID=3039283 RepID=UPI002A540F5A|nr:SufE family protein [Chitinispirillales bacterium ANBcel5]